MSGYHDDEYEWYDPAMPEEEEDDDETDITGYCEVCGTPLFNPADVKCLQCLCAVDIWDGDWDDVPGAGSQDL